MLTTCREVPVLAEAGPEVEVGMASTETVTAKHVGDFVWAVRLAKITKNGLQKTWGMETVTGKISGVGGVFGAESGREAEDVGEVVACHGLDAEVVEDPDLGCVFVLAADS